jgi:hypothetical protein
VAGTDYAAATNGTGGQALTSNGAGGFGTPVTLGAGATMSTTAGGDLSGTLPSPTVAQVNGAAIPTSGLLKGNSSHQIAQATPGTDYAAPPSGTNGQALTSNGSGGFGTPVTLGTAATANTGTTAGTVATWSGPYALNGTTIPASATLLVSGGPLGTPSGGSAANLTNLPINLTTTGTGGAATWSPSTNTLNVPQYTGGGGASPGGSTGNLQYYGAGGSLAGLPGSTATPALGSTTANLLLPGLTMSVTNPNVTGNPNGADAINIQSTTTSSSTNPNYSDENLADLQLSIANGQALYGNGTNAKKTFIAVNSTTTGGASGQKQVTNQTETTYGMSDNIVEGATLTYAGGPIAGDEGSYIARWVQQQQPFLTLTTLSSGAVRTSCNTTLSQNVTAASTAQTVTVASSTGCNVNDWVVIGRSAPTGYPNEIAVNLTAVGSGTLTGVFNANYSSGATVTPAAVITVASTYQFGQNRVLVDLSRATYTTGTVGGISSYTFTGSGTSWTNGMVGGDALNPGCVYLAADTYSGSPFNGSGTTGPLHSWYQIQSVGSNTALNIYSMSVAGDAAYHGYGPGSGGYQISPCAQVLYFGGTTVVLDTNSFTWSSGDSVELAIAPYSDTQSLWIQRAEFGPGGVHRPTVNVLNTGAVTQQAGISISGNMQGGNPLAFTTGLSIANAGTAINAGSPTVASMAINTNNSAAPITWAGTDGFGYLAPSSTSGYLAIGPDNYERNTDDLYLGQTNSGTCILAGCSNIGLAKYNGELILTGTNGNGVQGGGLRMENSSSAYQGVTMVATRNNSLPSIYNGGLYTEVDVNSTTVAPLKYEGYSSNLPTETYLPQATATGSANYSSADLALAASWWTGSAAEDGTWHHMAVPSTGTSPAVSLVMQYSANNAAPSTGPELAMSTSGKLAFGASTSALATIDASGLSANRNLTLPDVNGTLLTTTNGTTGVIACFKANGVLGYATMSGGNITACN